jgi:hypothetical protein
MRQNLKNCRSGCSEIKILLPEKRAIAGTSANARSVNYSAFP